MKIENDIRILVIGYGNPGRRDDGLGAAFAERIQALELPGIAVDADYQLTVEDSASIAQCDIVLFADASVNGPEPFELTPVQMPPCVTTGFSTHGLSAGALLKLSSELFGFSPKAFQLAIRGYDFGDFGEQLSERAQGNLEAAVAHLTPLFQTGFRRFS
ncbi:MAG TPA: hydrogenase maturation protease [Kiritimatiellia bacterium]|nr:hydrogenase maturation protease [Kiritimatiellia bacterium]HPS08285.1 hydrogenase maturation protease [Kiritimatiellia bacterium]